jgi:hypothetical protein
VIDNEIIDSTRKMFVFLRRSIESDCNNSCVCVIDDMINDYEKEVQLIQKEKPKDEQINWMIIAFLKITINGFTVISSIYPEYAIVVDGIYDVAKSLLPDTLVDDYGEFGLGGDWWRIKA